MKKVIKIFAGLLTVLAVGVLVTYYSCKKKEDEPEPTPTYKGDTASEDYNSVEANTVSNTMETSTDEVTAINDIADEFADPSLKGSKTNCIDHTWQPYQHTLTLTFTDDGSGYCKCRDDKYRKGTLTIVYSAFVSPFDDNVTRTITLSNYEVAMKNKLDEIKPSYQVAGTIILTNTDDENIRDIEIEGTAEANQQIEGVEAFAIKLYKGSQLQDATIKVLATGVLTTIDDNGSAHNRTDDDYNIVVTTGKAQLVNFPNMPSSLENVFDFDIPSSDPVVKLNDCQYAVDGMIRMNLKLQSKWNLPTNRDDWAKIIFDPSTNLPDSCNDIPGAGSAPCDSFAIFITPNYCPNNKSILDDPCVDFNKDWIKTCLQSSCISNFCSLTNPTCTDCTEDQINTYLDDVFSGLCGVACRTAYTNKTAEEKMTLINALLWVKNTKCVEDVTSYVYSKWSDLCPDDIGDGQECSPKSFCVDLSNMYEEIQQDLGE